MDRFRRVTCLLSPSMTSTQVVFLVVCPKSVPIFPTYHSHATLRVAPITHPAVLECAGKHELMKRYISLLSPWAYAAREAYHDYQPEWEAAQTALARAFGEHFGSISTGTTHCRRVWKYVVFEHRNYSYALTVPLSQPVD